MPSDPRRLARYRAALDAEAAEVASLQNRLAAVERQRQAAEHDAASLRVRIAALEQSSSWRLTAPFRSIALWFRRLRAGPPPDLRPRYRLEPSARTVPPEQDETVLVVSPVVPWPVRAGNQYRIGRMLDWLSASGRVPILVIAAVDDAHLETAARDELERNCPAFIWVGRDGTLVTGPGLDASLLAGLDGQPVAPHPAAPGDWRLAGTEQAYATDAVAGVVHALLRSATPRALIVNYVWLSSLLSLAPAGTLRVIDTHDVLSTKAAKVVSHGIAADDALTATEEEALLDRADLVLAIHDDDRQVLEPLVKKARVVTVGVDADIAPSASRPRSGARILFVASANALNVRGAEDFLRFAWDEIRAAVPDAELRLVGPIGGAIRSTQAGVTVVGPVDDLAAEYAAARLVINPVRAGTGLKIKTIEALAQGCPLVTWPAGADGLPADARRLCAVVETWPDFTEAVIEALAASPDIARAAPLRTLFAPEIAYAQLDAALRQ